MPLSFAEWDAARKGGQALDPTVTGKVASDQPPALAVDNPSVDDLLSQAKGTLSKADAFSKSIGVDRAVAPARKDYTPSQNTQPTPYGEGYKASPYDSPDTARTNELERTALAFGKGVAHSPVDMLKGALGIPKQIAEGYTSAIPTLLKDPSLLKEAPAAAVQGIKDIGADPETGGSLAGQLALGKAGPKGALKGLETATRMAPGVIGAPIEALGKGMEYAGTSRPVQALGKFGPLEALARGDWKGLAAAAVPPVLEYGGKALKSVGSRIRASDPLQGIMRAVAPVRNALASPLTMGAEEAIASPHGAPVSTEHVGYSLPSEQNDFNYEKPSPKFHNRPSLDALARLTDSAPPYSGPERRTASRTNDAGADVFHHASRTGRSITDEQMNALLKRFGGAGR